MLARATRAPRGRRNAFQRPPVAFDQLILPWLCPAQMRWAASTAFRVPKASNSIKRTPPRHASLRTESRSVSTAADAYSPSSAPPFAPPAQWGTSSELGGSDWALTPQSIFINKASIAAPPRLRFEKGIGGDPAELYQNLHACIRVGRLDRAAAIVRRLAAVYHPSAIEILDAHNVYLRAKLDAMLQDPVNSKMRDLEDWYNNDMVHKGIEPDDRTLVVMIKGALSLLHSERRDQAVGKYMDIAKDLGTDMEYAVNSSPEFTEEEWDTLIRIQGEDYDEPPVMIAEGLSAAVSTPGGREIAIEHGFMKDPTTEIRGIPQRGMGMETLKQALSAFDPPNALPYPHDMEGSQEEKDRAYAVMRQIQLEETAVDASVARWKYDDEQLMKIGIHGALKTKPMGALMWEWYTTLTPLIEKELVAVRKALANEATHKNSDRLVYGAYLELFDAKTLSAITVNKLVGDLAGVEGANSSNRIAPLAVNLATVLELEHTVRMAASRKSVTAGVKQSLFRQKALAKISKGKFKYDNSKQHNSESTQPSHLVENGPIFPRHVKVKIGALLIEKFLQSAKVTVFRNDPKTGGTLSSVQPAYIHSNIHVRGKQMGVLTLHSELSLKLTREPMRGQSTFRLPMVVEPKPWTSFNKGGYYRYPTRAVRMKDGDEFQARYAISAIQRGDMDQIFEGLDALGRVPWQINKEVFEVMVQAWNAGEGIGALVPGDIEVPLPAEPPSGAPVLERLRWYKAVKECNEKKDGLHSQRCFQNLQLEMARSYLNETIYYPHNIDFRGRAYPIPPTLNHMGADLARGLLKFAKGKELGSVGLKWLKIHLANLYGFDKASLLEREEFTMENLNHIYDSATNPLSGARWWLKAEDPWQCLACCFELKNALDSPDPARYVSSFPVHQDGTCNGLQHYAALGGDENGATQVNLEPSDRPQDIYTGVAELVKTAIAKDAKDGNEKAQFLDGKITRKVVKRTVMTNVYGVTFEGARLQVLDQLKDIEPDFQPSAGQAGLGSSAAYVAKQIFDALAQIFNGAQDIQFWLGACAARITTSVTAEQIEKLQEAVESGKSHEAFSDVKFKEPTKQKRKHTAKSEANVMASAMEFKSSVIWTTPLRMPVVQPYRKSKHIQIKTALQELTIMDPRASDAVSKRKQLQAFPPNFIHSLDATHMLLSALKCSEEGLTFAAVHDSFWTHPADVPKMNEILRDAFVRMHSEDIVGRLAAEFKARHAGSMYLADLKGESAAARQVLALRKETLGKKARTASYTELLVEADRQRLLHSEDAEERKKGLAMVTPASIYEAAQDASAMVTEVEQPLIGKPTPELVEKIQEKMISAELSEIEAQAGEPPADAVAEKSKDEKPARKLKHSGKIQIWLPLIFPPVPKKGDFDVRRLRESKYFFS
ncbi:DNA/RNA polymerase [Lophium mytilinum]|uniref:DNA-directed RNA polymerase n=1 Tax=Lophium mytilinum TaxID=390894 RepID=A0A6A6QQA9_9PEZI|nr:DNA/RNA polymerase [Lophium mytilinum]